MFPSFLCTRCRSPRQPLIFRFMLLATGIVLLLCASVQATAPTWFVGEGSNTSYCVIDYNDGKTPESLVWGYRYTGTQTGEDMLRAIVAADPRLTANLGETGSGVLLYGLHYDLDDDGGWASWTADPDTFSGDSDDHLAGGWMTNGYWGYYTSTDGADWDYSGVGLAARTLEHHSWDGHSFAPGFTTSEPSPATAAPQSATPQFRAPQQFTTAYHATTADASDPYYLLDNYRMSRTSGRRLAFDAAGNLHLAFWSGFLDTTPTSPSAVYHQVWARDVGWSTPTVVDQSYSSESGYEGQRLGGRHPSLTITPDDRVWIAWHDYRHCLQAAPANGINNTEIYCDVQSASETFTSDDLRLTSTSADHYGDNGYQACLVHDSTGRVSVCWYDFYVDGFTADLLLLTSDAGGHFDTSLSMAERRLTDADQRTGSPPPSFSMPGLAVHDGQRYAIWTQGTGGSFGGSEGSAPVYFASVPAQPALVSATVIVADNDGYWYPPRMAAAPDGGLWVVCTVLGETQRHLELLHRPPGASAFGSPQVLTPSGSHQNADLAIDSRGRLHLVWVEVQGYQNNLVHYRLLTADGQTTLDETTLTPTAGTWSSPAIALDDADAPYVVYGTGEVDTVGTQADLVFVEGFYEEKAAPGHSLWRLY